MDLFEFDNLQKSMTSFSQLGGQLTHIWYIFRLWPKHKYYKYEIIFLLMFNTNCFKNAKMLMSAVMWYLRRVPLEIFYLQYLCQIWDLFHAFWNVMCVVWDFIYNIPFIIDTYATSIFNCFRKKIIITLPSFFATKKAF